MTEALVELARRRKGQAPPPSIVWESLRGPFPLDSGDWLHLGPGETAPVVLDQSEPRLVVWSSIWEDEPELRIEFSIEPDRGGSLVLWRLLGPEGQLNPEDLGRRRHRLNQLINGQLRNTFDQ